MSKRMLAHYHHSSNMELKEKKNRSGTKEQRNEILKGWTNLSILAGDIMNSGEMEEEIKRLEAKATYLMDRLQMCYVEVEEWRTQYESLDDEK